MDMSSSYSSSAAALADADDAKNWRKQISPRQIGNLSDIHLSQTLRKTGALCTGNRSGDDDDTDCEGSKARRKEVMDIASSSSSAADNPPRREKYDVFISFRGEDTRLGITSHLHAALLQKKIETYIDYKLQSGEEIGPALLQAIEKSTISVIIFSQNYASSSWCLDELVHILECKERYGQMVIPVFYHINPSDVRKQHGSYADAFAQLEKRFDNSIDKVHKWRDALTTAANLSGFDYSNKSGTETEANLIQKVVNHILAKMCRESSFDLKGFVGIESRIKQIELLLGIHLPDPCITVGIWGMGGIGKTTLTEAVFGRHSSKFEASCFLKNVRENSEQACGLDHLEKTLFKELLKEEVSLPVGSTFQERLSRTKVLIVLDDVSSSMQMERLAGDRLQFGTGSRIIITTRDRGTLGQTVEGDNIYEVEGLQPDDALQLFCSRAFKDNSTRRTDYKELIEKAVHYAGRVPLALIVLGSLFFNYKSKDEWEEEFNKLKRFPSKDIQKVLRISYDGLDEDEKEIFLDIACFYKGEPVVEVNRRLASCGRYPETGIDNLINRCLISIGSKWGRETIEMHDLLQEMGRKIVQEQDIKDPGKWSRLFNDEDVYRVLRSNKETPYVEAIQVNWYYRLVRPLKHADFKKMSNLIMLIVNGASVLTPSLDLPDSLRYLNWRSYSWESLPSNFCPENLVELHLAFSNVKKLWKEEQILDNLQVINLEYCPYLTEFPNLSGSLNIVEINLRSCIGLVEIPSCFQHLDKLTHLDLGNCWRLKYLPEMPGNIQYLNLERTGIKELPESVWSNENISYLNITYCEDLEKLPSSRCKLKNPKKLDFNGCLRLKKLPSSCVDFLSLEVLILSYSRILEIPASIKQASRLSLLDLNDCKLLQSIPELPVLCNVKAGGCTSLKILSSSRTALTQGWDKPNYWYRFFTNCPKLDNNSRSNIMDEAQITIMRMARKAPHNPWPQINIACPGKEIPNWFSYQNEGSSVDIELCPDWFRTGLFGFALSVVVSRDSDVRSYNYTRIYNDWGARANFIVKFMGESHELFSSEYIISCDYNIYWDGQYLVLVWNKTFRSEEVGKNCSPDVYKLAKEASVVFCPVHRNDGSHMKVESCGICPLYAEDAEKFKLGHVFMSRGPKVEEETKQDEPQASGSCDESEANESDDHGSEVSGTEDDSSDESEANESD
ncbi:unnamed protein product [Malus baccata var. baccata]